MRNRAQTSAVTTKVATDRMLKAAYCKTSAQELVSREACGQFQEFSNTSSNSLAPRHTGRQLPPAGTNAQETALIATQSSYKLV